MVKVFIIENGAPFDAVQLDHLSRCLPATVIESAKRYRRWQDVQAFLLGRYLLLEGLKRNGYENDLLPSIEYSAYKRPYLPIPLDFNISHSGSYVVCAFSTHKVGIDIEEMHPVEINDFTHCFTTSELSEINNAPDKYHEFFRCWTIKEAVIKADGKGLSIPLETIVISDKIRVEDTTWFIHKMNIAPGYAAHLATNEVLEQGITVERISLPK
jgi:4'-phosphopantetheinyl transferase